LRASRRGGRSHTIRRVAKVARMWQCQRFGRLLGACRRPPGVGVAQPRACGVYRGEHLTKK